MCVVCVRATPQGYAGEMAFWLIVPCVLEIIIVIGAAIWLAVRTEFTLGRLIPAVAPLSLRMLFLLYPLVTRKAFEAWSFYEFVEGDFLRADVSLRKGSPEYSQAESLAILAILLCAALTPLALKRQGRARRGVSPPPCDTCTCE